MTLFHSSERLRAIKPGGRGVPGVIDIVAYLNINAGMELSSY